MTKACVTVLAASAAAVLLIAGGANASTAASPRVVVPRGQPVQVALAIDLSGSASELGTSIENAVSMAVAAHKYVRGFAVRVNVVDAPCGAGASAHVAAADSIVANAQNVAVLGHVCSAGFDAALPVYQAAGVVTISGSATADMLPARGPSVFNRTAVSDGQEFEEWYVAVGELPRNLDWQEAYADRFDTEAMAFADLYYDAARVLIRNIQKVSQIGVGRKLVIHRAALARAVRATTAYQGVTCVVTLDSRTGNRINDAAALERCSG